MSVSEQVLSSHPADPVGLHICQISIHQCIDIVEIASHACEHEPMTYSPITQPDFPLHEPGCPVPDVMCIYSATCECVGIYLEPRNFRDLLHEPFQNPRRIGLDNGERNMCYHLSESGLEDDHLQTVDLVSAPLHDSRLPLDLTAAKEEMVGPTRRLDAVFSAHHLSDASQPSHRHRKISW